MVTTKLDDLQKLFDQYIQSANTQQLVSTEIKEPDPSALDKIWHQRHGQRDRLFNFALNLTNACFIFLVCITFFQMWSQLAFQRDLLTGYELEVLSVSVFGQIIAVVIIIAKSIWDDKPYSNMLGSDHKRVHRE
jgi:hypothetical protein